MEPTIIEYCHTKMAAENYQISEIYINCKERLFNGAEVSVANCDSVGSSS